MLATYHIPIILDATYQILIILDPKHALCSYMKVRPFRGSFQDRLF